MLLAWLHAIYSYLFLGRQRRPYIVFRFNFLFVTIYIYIYVSGFEKRDHFAQYVNDRNGSKQSRRWIFTQIQLIAYYASVVYARRSDRVSSPESFPKAEATTEFSADCIAIHVYGLYRKCNTEKSSATLSGHSQHHCELLVIPRRPHLKWLRNTRHEYPLSVGGARNDEETTSAFQPFCDTYTGSEHSIAVFSK